MQSPELSDLLRSAAAPLLAWVLTYLVHSTILLAGAWLATRRVKSHGVRETLWKTALFGGFITATLQPAMRLQPLSGKVVVAPAAAADFTAVASESSPADDQPAASATIPATPPPAPRTPFIGIREAAVLSWATGAVMLLAFYLIRRKRFLRELAGRRPVMTHPLAAVLEELSAEAGIIGPIRLSVSSVMTSPIALGRSEIVVPEAALTELDRDQQRGMLAHELAHLERRDPFWLTAACLAERAGFLQPLNRLARLRIQESAEYLCDEWAAARTGSGVFLARCLAKVAEWIDAAPRQVAVAGMAEERSHLVARVRRLLEGAPFTRTPARRTLVAASTIAILATVIALPGVSFARRQSDSSGLTSQNELKSFKERQSVQAAGDTGRAVVVALIAAARDSDLEVRRAALHSLSRFEDPATLPAFREALRDADAEIRAIAAEALGERKDRSSAGALAEALKDESAEVRRAAAGALGEIRSAAARDPLIAALKDPDAEVRERVIHALAELRDPAAVEGLIAAMKDPKPEVRARAIDALTELELAQAPAGLLDALRDPNADVRHQAAHAVGHFQDARAVPTLRGLIEDVNEEVRTAAVEALAEIRTDEAIQALVAALKAKDPKVRRAAADALGQRQ